MNGSSIARMEDFDPFSEEGRRIAIPLCEWQNQCSGFGEYQNIIAINGLPMFVKLCKKHDVTVNELRGLHGQPITDLDGLMGFFKSLVGKQPIASPAVPGAVLAAAPENYEDAMRAAEEARRALAQAEGLVSYFASGEETSKAHEEKPQPESEEPAPQEAPEVPQEAAKETAPVLDFTEPEEEQEPAKEPEEKPEEKPPASRGAYNLAARPSPDHVFCVETAKTGKPCNRWMTSKSLEWHAKSVHGIKKYQNHTLPQEEFVCRSGDHIAAGCVMSFQTEAKLSTHQTMTKLELPPPKMIPRPSSEPTPQQQPANADRATA